MLKSCAVAAAFCLAAPVSAKGGKVASAASEIRALARYQAPKNWTASEDRLGADPVVAFSRPPYAIRIQLLGGEGSRHASAADFLDSLEAKGEGGRPAKLARKARVAGALVSIYSRVYKSDEKVVEEFCVVPAGGRFFVLTYSASAPGEPDLRPSYQRWSTFLSSFKKR